MRSLTALALVLAVVAAGCAGGDDATETVTVTAPTPTGAQDTTPPAEIVEFGHIAELTRGDSGWTMRFDPAWFLSGETANEAAAEDGAVEPGQRRGRSPSCPARWAPTTSPALCASSRAAWGLPAP